MLTTLPPSCAVVMKSGNLNFLEPSGPLQACNGTALPFCHFVKIRSAFLEFQEVLLTGGQHECAQATLPSSHAV